MRRQQAEQEWINIQNTPEPQNVARNLDNPGSRPGSRPASRPQSASNQKQSSPKVPTPKAKRNRKQTKQYDPATGI